MRLILLFIVFRYHLLSLNATFIEILPYTDPNQCNRSEYFDAKLLKCKFCDFKKYLISTTDKEKCICNERSNSVYDSSKLFSLHCEKCKSNTIFSREINSCIKCSNGVFKKNNVTQCRLCKENEIIVYHTRNGTFLNQTRCISCTNGMVPSADGSKCIPCPIFNPIKINGTIKCMCDYKSVRLGNLCIASTLFPDLTNNKKKYFLQYHTGEKINSRLFDEHLKSNIYLCKLQNSTACQILANLCTLTLFSSYENSPCNLWLDLRNSINLDNKLPWLLYREGDAGIVLNRKTISAEYSLDSLSIMSRLNLTAAIFYFNGSLKEIKPLLGSDIILCPDLNYIKDNALRFGINYYYECSIDARQFFRIDRKTEFIVPYLQYLENGKPMLYALPVLIRNLAQYKNNDDDMTTWLLVRRFFMFDTISSIGTESNEPSLLRYVKSFQIKVKLRSGEHNGLIYPPLIVLEYGEISQKQYCHGERIKFQFSASYEMKSNMKQSIEIAVGVLSTLAVVYSGIQTWSYSKRSGKIAIDLVTLIRLCIFLCGNLANTFFVVAFGVSVHTFIFYKGQSVVHLLLPTNDEEDIIRRYIIVAFVLKIIEITDLIWRQITIDIFLIDWERPRPQDTIPRPNSKSSPFTITSSSYTQQSVSIWRSYFIANEWNEIQTKRKVNLLIHMLAIAFLLKVVGVEFWGTADPELHTTIPNHLKNVPLSFICRFAVGCLVYVTVYLIQLLLMVVLYERYIQNAIQQFVDVCSLTNISVFIFSLERYGYYIHGRSSHGFADTDMATMIKQLKREEDDLCAYRGLLPGTHHQTFSVGVPAKLRLYYNKLMIPTKINTTNGHNMNLIDDSPNKSSTNMKTNNFDKIIQAYHNVNKFLSAFLEHALKDLDYDIKDRLFIESLLDIEFTDCLDRGILLTDSGHSFDNILFYGNEFCLFTFDIMLFSSALMLTDDFVLTILITLCISEIFKIIRKIGGKRNLAEKTLIDERFLI